jgi:hypothetical protein
MVANADHNASAKKCLPAGLHDTGNITGMRELPEAQTAKPEFAQKRARATA